MLVVCEKRAAIDVVYHRLQQQKLHQLCSLIHDALADKKEFVMDLKRTYESFRADASRGHGTWETKRDEIHQAVTREIRPLERFGDAMESEPEPAGVPLRELFQPAVELSELRPQLSAVEKEALPTFAEWDVNRERIARLTSILEDIGDGGVLARHRSTPSTVPSCEARLRRRPW
ncbi:MAG: hypothetical protein BMS9Abin37_2475 [Acidobacteriota bacterium]|nr:MAG: hypothetical protein BMS9Abin37_2475 [Acidobacteriota bacterium]